MAVELNFTKEDVLEQIRLFLEAVLPDNTPAIQGQDNRVPEPLQGDYVIMTPVRQERLSTNVERYDPTPGAATMDLEKSSKWGVQLDVHGDASAANSERISTLWRSGWACSFFAGSILSPLFADEPLQSAFHNGEAQYESRWIVTIYLQAKPVLTLPQDYATELAIQTYEADQ